jgi:hypothetical protein
MSVGVAHHADARPTIADRHGLAVVPPVHAATLVSKCSIAAAPVDAGHELEKEPPIGADVGGLRKPRGLSPAPPTAGHLANSLPTVLGVG